VPLAFADAAPAVRRGLGLVLGRYERNARGTAATLHCHRCGGCREFATRAGYSGCETSCAAVGARRSMGEDII